MKGHLKKVLDRKKQKLK